MAIKNIGELGLDEITEDYLMAECEDMGAELGVDTHQGSVYMDACSGHIIRTAKFFNDLATVNEILSILTCTGDVLTEKMMERGMERNPPADTAATYYDILWSYNADDRYHHNIRRLLGYTRSFRQNRL